MENHDLDTDNWATDTIDDYEILIKGDKARGDKDNGKNKDKALHSLLINKDCLPKLLKSPYDYDRASYDDWWWTWYT